MDIRDIDPEIAALATLVFILAIVALSIGLLPQFPLPFKYLPLILGLLLTFLGGCALWVNLDPGSQLAFWFVLAKDIAIGAACLMLGLVIGCGQG